MFMRSAFISDLLLNHMAVSSSPTAQQTLTVAQLTAQIKNSLEGEFTSVWVVGEISNYSRPQSGHAYFTLKDDQAQIRAVMWRFATARLSSTWPMDWMWFATGISMFMPRAAATNW